MAIALFTHEDPLPDTYLPPHISIAKTYDSRMLHQLTKLSRMEIERRFIEQNDAWVVWVNDIPAAFGWAARFFAPIGELETFFHVKRGQLYLWNFRTLEAWRGKGLYPLLLQHIIRAEISQGIEKIWIISKPENTASQRGIIKAGFTVVGELSFNSENDLVLLPVKRGEKADDAADFLNVPIVEADVKPCWYCHSPAMADAGDNCGCNTGEAELEKCSCRQSKSKLYTFSN